MPSKKKKKPHEMTTEEAIKTLFHPKIVKQIKKLAVKARKK